MTNPNAQFTRQDMAALQEVLAQGEGTPLPPTGLVAAPTDKELQAVYDREIAVLRRSEPSEQSGVVSVVTAPAEESQAYMPSAFPQGGGQISVVINLPSAIAPQYPHVQRSATSAPASYGGIATSTPRATTSTQVDSWGQLAPAPASYDVAEDFIPKRRVLSERQRHVVKRAGTYAIGALMATGILTNWSNIQAAGHYMGNQTGLAVQHKGSINMGTLGEAITVFRDPAVLKAKRDK